MFKQLWAEMFADDITKERDVVENVVLAIVSEHFKYDFNSS